MQKMYCRLKGKYSSLIYERTFKEPTLVSGINCEMLFLPSIVKFVYYFGIKIPVKSNYHLKKNGLMSGGWVESENISKTYNKLPRKLKKIFGMKKQKYKKNHMNINRIILLKKDNDKLEYRLQEQIQVNNFLAEKIKSLSNA